MTSVARHGRRGRLGLVRGMAAGAVAGAAGTTALNCVTYADMSLRARPASDTPERAVEEVANKAQVTIPGTPNERKQRLAGLGPLSGALTGVVTGAMLGALYGLGWHPRRGGLALTAAATAMVAGNGPMIALGVTNPREWSATDWVSDVVPHLAYGAVAALVLASRRSMAGA